LAAEKYKQEDGISTGIACDKLCCYHGVLAAAGYDENSDNVNRLRTRLLNYIRRCRKHGIHFRNVLRYMEDVWRWHHRGDLKEEWCQHWVAECKDRIFRVDEAIKAAQEGGEANLVLLKVGQMITLAKAVHDSECFDEAKEHYEAANADLCGIGGGAYLYLREWITEQINRCNRHVGPSHPPVWVESRLERVVEGGHR
jgi:hypothetical protein